MAYRRKDVNRGANTSTNTRRRRKGSGRKRKMFYEDRNISIEDLGKEYLIRHQPIPSQRRAGITGLQTLTVPKSAAAVPSNAPDPYCMSMFWSNPMGLGPLEGAENLPYGPNIETHLGPPTNSGFGNISGVEFAQFFGTTNANGDYFLNASAKLDMLMTLLLAGNSAICNLPIINHFFLVLSGKARLIRFNGEVQELYFQAKNLNHLLTIVPNDSENPEEIANIIVGNTNHSFLTMDTGGQKDISDFFYYANTLEPINASNAPSQEALTAGGYVGLPLINDFHYGDKIFIENISAGYPNLGLTGCGMLLVGVDSDGDGEVDDYYGNSPGYPTPYTVMPSESKSISITL